MYFSSNFKCMPKIKTHPLSNMSNLRSCFTTFNKKERTIERERVSLLYSSNTDKNNLKLKICLIEFILNYDF